MATIFNRGFAQRSLPALLALILGLLVAGQPVGAVESAVAATLHATTRTAVTERQGPTAPAKPAATPPAEPTIPVDDATEQILPGPRTLRAQHVASALGSRAPPAVIA